MADVDQEQVRLSLILGPVDDAEHVYSDPLPRWLAIAACRDFGAGIEWDGRPVMRALIVGPVA